jgi:IMP dehydrogenase
MNIIMRALAFDDVLLVPMASDVVSRTAVDTSTNVGGIEIGLPIISSPMDTVTEGKMAVQIGLFGGLGIIHRFCSVEEQIGFIREPVNAGVKHGFSIGVGREEVIRFSKIYSQFKDQLGIVCIDIANGHSSLMRDMVNFIKDIAPEVNIMAGNVATAEGYAFLAELGVNSVRVGIGGGSICKTRIQTGFGVPTLTSVMLASEAKKKGVYGASIIADGGIRYPADLVKSLAAGADAVICGSILAGSKEAPGEVISWNDGMSYKKYRGMASEEIQNEKRGGLKPKTCAEGTSTLVMYKGPVQGILEEFEGGLRSGLTYNGSMTIKELQETAKFTEITASGIRESHSYGTIK